MANKINDALGVVGAWVASHPELEPSKIEFTVATILRFLKKQKREITVSNMNAAFDQVCSAVEAMRPEEEPEAETTPEQDAETEKLVRQIA